MSRWYNDAWLRLTSRTMLAYRRVFQHGGKVSSDGERVLRDLAEFCNHTEPSTSLDSQGRVDGLAMAVREGRREAFLHVLKMLDRGAYTDIQKRLAETPEEEN